MPTIAIALQFPCLLQHALWSSHYLTNCSSSYSSDTYSTLSATYIYAIQWQAFIALVVSLLYSAVLWHPFSL